MNTQHEVQKTGSTITTELALVTTPIRSYFDNLVFENTGNPLEGDLMELTKRIVQVPRGSIDDALKSLAGGTVNKICNSIIFDTDTSNSLVVRKAFWIGAVLIVLRDKMETTEGDIRSYEAYDKLMESMLNEYADSVLLPSMESGRIDKATNLTKKIKLSASRRRQLNKYVSLAQCGPKILEYSHGGIEAALEVRYLVLDIMPKPQKGKKQVTPELFQQKLDAAIREFPFPRLTAQDGEDTRSVFRLHTDKVATIFQCRLAGFRNEDVNEADAEGYANRTGRALKAEEAEEFFETLENVSVEEHRTRLSKYLRAANPENKHRKQNAAQIVEHLAKICQWGRDVQITDKKIQEIKALDQIQDRLTQVIAIATNLYSRIQTSTSPSNAQVAEENHGAIPCADRSQDSGSVLSIS